MKFFPLATCALSLALLSCGSYVNNPSPGGSSYLAGVGVSSSTPVPHNPAEASKFWDGDSISGTPAIRINRAEQKAYFYKSGELVGVTPVSTGDDEHPTPPGTFKVTEKAVDYASNRYGKIIDANTGATIIADADSQIHKPGPGQKYVGAPMPNFLRFNWGIGMHGGYLPGYAASHGCVRLPNDMAQKFFEHAPVGTPVIVE